MEKVAEISFDITKISTIQMEEDDSSSTSFSGCDSPW